MIRMTKALAGLLLAGVLAACGGGGGSPGTNPLQPPPTTGGGGGGTTDPTSNPTALVADFVLLTDKTSITNTGLDSAKLTVIALDANRNVVKDATVTTTVDQNAVFVPAGTTTDASGTYTGQVQSGSDKTDRDITVAVTINGVTKRTTVRVTGTKLTLAASPNPATPGQALTVTASMRDAAGNAIVGVPVTFGGTAGVSTTPVNTNASGDAVLAFNAPVTTGVYTISASGGGTLAADYQVQVYASGGGVPAAVVPVGTDPSLSASPNVLSVNSVGSTTNKSSIRFLILDNTNTPIPNVRVRFNDLTMGQARTGASLSTTEMVYTDSSGTVTTQYIAGQNSSPTNGVTIQACWSANDFAAGACPNQKTVTLTVAGQALAISVGDDNLLVSQNGLYIKRFAVTVADSAGRAVANAPVSISVDLTHYSKGDYSSPFLTPGGAPTFGLNVVPLSLTAAYPADTTNPATRTERVWCANEDIDRDAVLDGGEDINANGSLEPRKSDLLINYDNPTVTSTDANGVLIIRVTYSQKFATWLAYKIRVTTNVGGSEGMAERLFVTDFLEADKDNGSFWTPPYGVNSCRSAN